MSVHAYKQPFKADTLTFELAKESGKIYSKAMLLNKKEHKSFKEITKIMEKYCKENRKYLHSQSAQASYQNFITNLKSFFEALKTFNKNPSGFSGKPRPPHKNKFMYKIIFKKSAIHCNNGYMLLSVKKPYEPIKIKWAKDLPIPLWVEISYNKYDGWNISFVMEEKCELLELDKNKVMTIDPGNKRTATTFNNVDSEVTTYNGKIIMSLVRLRNVVDGRIKTKQSKCKKRSRYYKILARVKRKIVKRIKNKENDILHKYSRKIVNDAVSKGIGKIVSGDNSSTHNKTDCGKQNQKIQQNPERKLIKLVEYKFARVGGQAEAGHEQYTSRTCPKCGYVKNTSPKGRTYSCSNPIKCDFAYDRDGVGAIGIMKKNVSNVSFDHKEWLDVVGGLTPPIGVKYHKKTPRLSLVSSNRNKIPNNCLASNGENSILGNFSELVNLEKLEEPHVL